MVSDLSRIFFTGVSGKITNTISFFQKIPSMLNYTFGPCKIQSFLTGFWKSLLSPLDL